MTGLYRNSMDRSSSESLGGGGTEAVPSAKPEGTLSATSNTNYHGSKDRTTEDTSSVDEVLRSDIGVSTLLARLKQSIASTRDFATFLKKRSALEEKHSQSLKDLCRTTLESSRRAESRQGSFARNYDEVTRIHDRMADNGIQFALSLHHMHDDLQELAADKERTRKQWKASGLSAEKRVIDAESAMEKAKVKYNSLAEEYDRVRTGDKQSGRFGLKGPKSAAQVEEDLQRKVQVADSDYLSKVQGAQSLRKDLEHVSRPQTIQAVQQLTSECDSGLTLQMQRFASLIEKLLLSNGLCVHPFQGPDSNHTTTQRSLRDVIGQIDNEQDFKDHILAFSNRIPKASEASYERHPAFQTQPLQGNSRTPQTLPQVIPSNTTTEAPAPVPDMSLQGPSEAPHSELTVPSTIRTPLDTQGKSLFQVASDVSPSSSHQLPSLQESTAIQTSNNNDLSLERNGHSKGQIFGISLEELFTRDGSAVPLVVYQCLQAINLFGLDAEGIYRQSGNASHITHLKALFNSASSSIDFRNPENFYHDVHSVAGLLKLFFRELPDPLFTSEHYQSFIDAARIDDDVTRRDSLHATINSLPDPHYATLRAISLHLHRVQEHFHSNRMNTGNLAICLGPTLMGASTSPNIADAGWQVRVIDTILQNTYQIFDEDD